MAKRFVFASIENGGEKRLLLIVVFSKEVSIGCREERATEDACTVAEVIDALHRNT